MSSDKPRKPSWRSEVPKKATKSEAARPAWQREAAAPVEATPRWNRKTKIGVGVFGFLAFNALLIWVIYWLWPPKPSCLVLLGAGYEDNLSVPHNVYGANGLDGLAELARGGSGNVLNMGGLLHLKHDPRELKAGDEWDRGLDDFKERTILIYLAMHGGADADGPYLLRQDSEYKEPSKLRLSAVLDVLRAKVPPEKKKVLILDATQVPADWSLGMLQNGFARGLHDLSKDIEAIPNLVVLSASEPDERSWGSEELRKTVFTHFVIEGLKGAADEDHNGRVDAKELHEYVKRNVSRWARANRAARQTPVLLGGVDRARDIEIVVVKDEYQAPNYAEIPPFEAPRSWAKAGNARRSWPHRCPRRPRTRRSSGGNTSTSSCATNSSSAPATSGARRTSAHARQPRGRPGSRSAAGAAFGREQPRHARGARPDVAVVGRGHRQTLQRAVEREAGRGGQGLGEDPAIRRRPAEPLAASAASVRGAAATCSRLAA